MVVEDPGPSVPRPKRRLRDVSDAIGAGSKRRKGTISLRFLADWATGIFKLAVLHCSCRTCFATQAMVILVVIVVFTLVVLILWAL